MATEMPVSGREGSAMTQRSRDLIAGELTLDYFMKKAAEGWKLAAVEWVREVPDSVSDRGPMEVSVRPEQIPYGLRIAEDGMHLERNPLEVTVLLLILEEIVKEKRITEIALDLNVNGYKTRNGSAWSATAVFELLPRLIEMGPALLKSPEWMERRGGSGTPN
jgi:Recombinase